MTMMTLPRFRQTAAWLKAAAVVWTLFTAGSAMASDRWEEAGSGAVAILPVPSETATISGGSLVCAEQRWTMRLRAPDLAAIPGGAVKVTIDGESFPLVYAQTSGAVTLPVTREMLEGLKAGGRLALHFGGDDSTAGAKFALRNSRAVIDAIAPRCSQVDMAGYDKLALSGSDPAVETAAPLLAEELKLFRAATSSKPEIFAARLDRGEGRELLFANLCGSSWYYGRTGCSLFGFTRGAADGQWTQVYNTEGVSLYIDPSASKDGWPNLVTLELDGYEPAHWQWNGGEYRLADPRLAADEPPDSTKSP